MLLAWVSSRTLRLSGHHLRPHLPGRRGFDLEDADRVLPLAPDPDEAHCCQKTLHNFRAKLMASEADELVFRSLTDRILAVVGVDIGKQRLDSTHIMSNIARLTRLGLLCETIRLFLSTLKSESPEKFDTIPETLRRRYLKDDGKETRFGDAPSKETRRRLAVCARDVTP